MWLGLLGGGGLGWLAARRTADGSLARLLVDGRTAWLYLAAFAGVLALAVAAAPRVASGAAGALAVGLGAAAIVTLRPDEAVSAHLGAPLGVAAGLALAAALFAGLVPRSGDVRHRAGRVRRRLQARA
jgi:hypothetical protein